MKASVPCWKTNVTIITEILPFGVVAVTYLSSSVDLLGTPDGH